MKFIIEHDTTQVRTQVDSALRQMIVIFSDLFTGKLGSNDTFADKDDKGDEDVTYEEFEPDELSAENQAPLTVEYTHYLCKTENCSKFYTIHTLCCKSIGIPGICW